MINKEHKKKMIVTNIYDYYSFRRNELFKNGLDIDDINNYDLDKDDFEECKRIKNSRRMQRKKIKNHINYLMNREDYSMWFLTFTIKNEKYDIKEETHRKKVIECLNKFVEDYILNIDFGSKNERRHYHVIIATKRNLKFKEYLKDYEEKIGFIGIEQIRLDYKSNIKLSAYMDKLVSHSIKVKQTYISVKKGSDYQEHQEQKRISKEYQKKKREQIRGHYGYWSKKYYDDYFKWIIRPIYEREIKELKEMKFDEMRIDFTSFNVAPYQVRRNQQKKTVRRC